MRDHTTLVYLKVVVVVGSFLARNLQVAGVWIRAFISWKS